MKPVRRLREPFVEVPCTEGSTKAPWRVHEASSRGPWRNFVGFLHDDACICKYLALCTGSRYPFCKRSHVVPRHYGPCCCCRLYHIHIYSMKSVGRFVFQESFTTHGAMSESRDLLQSFYGKIGGRVSVVDDQLVLK